jgi:hypothetical protein
MDMLGYCFHAKHNQPVAKPSTEKELLGGGGGGGGRMLVMILL